MAHSFTICTGTIQGGPDLVEHSTFATYEEAEAAADRARRTLGLNGWAHVQQVTPSAAPPPPTSDERAIDDMARRLVETDVRYCVSSLIFTLHADAGQEGSLMSDHDAFTLAARAPDADDYRDADRFAMIVRQSETGGWEWGEGETIDGTADSELEAWQAAYDATHQDYPDGSDCLEHWLVTDDLARRLREQGEAVADDIAGLTVWGRCTSGQAIYADAVIQRIARNILEA